MKQRADRAIKDNEIGWEGWAQMVTRASKAFPEIVKEFLTEQFLLGEESASAKVTPLECASLLRAHFPDEDCWLKESQGPGPMALITTATWPCIYLPLIRYL